ncbi:N-acetylglutaminylglutamine amidotransferase [Planctomycetales bacterium ZRK34]|nr:N-acetylglutaminylglutamine amidotransferase [Planctomycetales bacterium ZRK34]
MCGICGEVVFDGRPPATDVVKVMTERLESRGPDAQGVYQHNGSMFGHRRLSIIDLSEKSNQPMFDKKLGLGIVYNGEIYNYHELREELSAKGYNFFSGGDTEVLIKAYHAWGDDFVKRLNGMFAFAIWNQQTGAIFMGRDRLGIKPLYYSLEDQKLRFASSLPAMIAAGDVDTSLDPIALHHYMTFHSVVPAPYTIFRGVRKLPPATVMNVAPDGTASTKTYWAPNFNQSDEDRKRSAAEWQELILETLRASVKRRLIADVPVGVLLSGGLDSSLVVGLLAESGQKGLNTFSIGFDTVGDEEGNEFKYSDVIAEHFGTEHHKIKIDSSRALSELERCIYAMSEPMVSHDVIGFYLLSEEVSKHVKVVQSGQGADEVFGGYHWYPPMLDSADAVSDYARVFFDRDHADYAQAMNPDRVEDDYSRAFVAEHFARDGADRPIDKALRLDTTIMLVDDPVKRVDNMTMAWGLEARVPFLDHELVELAGRIPAELKLEQEGKGVLKDAARKVIPSGVIDRPKGYFPVPALKFLRGEYLEKVREVLTDPAAQQRDLFNKDYVNKLLAKPEEHITPLRGSKLWQMALLEWWLQTHQV